MHKSTIKQYLMFMTTGVVLAILGYAGYDTVYHGPVAQAAGKETAPAHEEIQLLSVGTEAPNFILPGIDGKDYQLLDYRGKRVVLLEFFASWCPHCQHSVPQLQKLQKDLPKVQILTVNAGDKPPQRSTSKAFQAAFGISYPVLEEPSDAMIGNYKVQAFPTLYLIGKDGKIAWSHDGTLQPAEREKLEALIKPKL